MMWEVHYQGKVRSMTEEELSSKLRKNKLTGVELARRESDEEWTPLHSTPLYRNVVPSMAPLAGTRQRIIGSFVKHFIVFVTVLATLKLGLGVPIFWAPFWGIVLIFHAMRTARQLAQLRATPPKPRAIAPLNAQQTNGPPLLVDNEVLRAIAELDQAGWSGDTAALRDTAALLIQRRALVEDALEGDAKAALEQERADVLADREGASASTQALLDDQLGAIDARLSFLRDVHQQGVRLRAQERTLLHQVESLRLGQIQATQDTTTPDLMTAVTRLRRELDAESEVTDALARARQAARP